MHLLTSIIVILAISAFSTVAFSAEKKVLLISDIDDTIKASHVLNSKAVVSRFANLTMILDSSPYWFARYSIFS